MNSQRTFFDDIKHQYKYGGATIRLIFINIVVFLLISFLGVLARLLAGDAGSFIGYIVDKVFVLHTDFDQFVIQPWGLFTSIFSHIQIFHLLFNMLFLYFAGRTFEQLFDQKRLYWTYVLGGLFGGLLEVVAHLIFPGLMEGVQVVGASGSIMAIFFAIAFYKPDLKFNLFFIEIRVIFIAIIFFLRDFISLGSNDTTAHFAHIGGALFGIWSVYNVYNSSNVVNFMQNLGGKIVRFFTVKRKPKLKVNKGGKNVRTQSDEEYNQNKQAKQAEIDRILDKISKSGYDSLSKKEKDFLFNQSNK